MVALLLPDMLVSFQHGFLLANALGRSMHRSKAYSIDVLYRGQDITD